MSVSADEITAHGDEDHGVRDVNSLLVVAHEAPPAGHPTEGHYGHYGDACTIPFLAGLRSRLAGVGITGGERRDAVDEGGDYGAFNWQLGRLPPQKGRACGIQDRAAPGVAMPSCSSTSASWR